MTFLLLAVFIAGALISGPAWMAHGRKLTLEELEDYRRRRDRENR